MEALNTGLKNTHSGQKKGREGVREVEHVTKVCGPGHLRCSHFSGTPLLSSIFCE